MVRLPQFVGTKLEPLSGIFPASLRLWQYKSLNLHRGVIHLDATSSRRSVPQLRAEVRDVVRDHFRPSWWRGFGFGAVISLDQWDDSFEAVSDLVDDRNNRRGVWQWVVLHVPRLRVAIGVRTWKSGFLTPSYHELLSALGRDGFTCEDCQKDVDTLTKTLGTLKKFSIEYQLLKAAGLEQIFD